MSNVYVVDAAQLFSLAVDEQHSCLFASDRVEFTVVICPLQVMKVDTGNESSCERQQFVITRLDFTSSRWS